LDASSIAKALYLSPESAKTRLLTFAKSDLLTASAGGANFAFNDTNSINARLIGELSGCYRHRRASVITEIFSNPIPSIQTFADAFVFGKQK
jgi:hypothetical protein